MNPLPPSGPQSSPLESARSPLLERPLNELPLEQLRELFTVLPKIELHRHLEGSLTPEVLIELAGKYSLTLPSRDPETLRPYVQVHSKDRTLLDFLKKFEVIGRIFISPELISDLSFKVTEDALREGIKHLELRYSPSYMALTRGIPIGEVISAVEDGLSRARAQLGISVQSIVIVERQMPEKYGYGVLEAATPYLGKGVAAIDLANDEANFPPELFLELFQEAHRRGFKITVHAGEAGPAENIRVAVELLHADRIGHGVRALDDANLRQDLKRKKICLEMCPTSNQQTGAVLPGGTHPLRMFLDEGLCATLNTDDPGVCGVSLTDEWLLVVRDLGISWNHVAALSQNAVQSALLPLMEREQLLKEMSKKLSELRGAYLP